MFGAGLRGKPRGSALIHFSSGRTEVFPLAGDGTYIQRQNKRAVPTPPPPPHGFRFSESHSSIPVKGYGGNVIRGTSAFVQSPTQTNVPTFFCRFPPETWVDAQTSRALLSVEVRVIGDSFSLWLVFEEEIGLSFRGPPRRRPRASLCGPCCVWLLLRWEEQRWVWLPRVVRK